MEKIVLVGFGGHSKSVIDVIERQKKYEIAGLIDVPGQEELEYRGYRMIGTDDQLETIYNSGVHNAFVTVGFMGKSLVRNRIYQKLKQTGFQLPVIVDPSAILAEDSVIGEGTFIGKRAVINADVCVGKMCIINTGAILEHETYVKDFCHISVGSILCGQVHVGENTFIGAGSTVIQGIGVGSNCIVGAGTTLVKSLESGILTYGRVNRRIEE